MSGSGDLTEYGRLLAQIAGTIAGAMMSQEKQPSGRTIARRSVAVAKLVLDEVRNPTEGSHD